MRTHRETLIVNLLKSIEGKDVEGFSAISQSQYRQHNLHVADGRQGFLDFVFSMPDGMPKVSTRRVFEDGEYVVAHSELVADQTLAVFDIFKFDGERIVEHWDAAQPRSLRRSQMVSRQLHDQQLTQLPTQAWAEHPRFQPAADRFQDG